MSNWKTVRVGEVCKSVSSGGTPKSNVPEYYEGGDIPWLNTKEVNFNRIYSTEKYITSSGLQNSAAKWIEKNSIIVAMYGATAGKVAVTKIPLTTNQACCNLTIDSNLADYRFVYYHILNNYTQLASLANGGAQQNLNSNHIKDFPILLPSLEEQERIAGILGALDDKIECNNRINRNLEEQAAALFRRWFVDFEFPDSNGNPYRSAGGAMQDSPLGEIPQGWQVGKFTDIIDILGGGTPNTGTNDYWNGQIPFFTPKDAKDNLYTILTEKYITDKGLDKCNSKLYPEETVFITARGTVGKVAIAGCDMAMNQSCYALVGKNSIGQYFVYHITKETVSLLRNKANGAVFDAITTRDFESELIIIPAEKLSYKFNNTVKSLMKLILSNTVENQILATLRDTLLPKLMNNEIKAICQ